jgi:hypothetical protein
MTKASNHKLSEFTSEQTATPWTISGVGVATTIIAIIVIVVVLKKKQSTAKFNSI